jgi:hypothetical protein
VPITRVEVEACLAVAADLDPHGDLPDPIQWLDLTSQPEHVVDTVWRRFSEGQTPGNVQVFEWPKDRHGWRPMATMDPFDQIAYRALVGRNVKPIAASVDTSVVLSSRLVASPPRWRVEPHHVPVGQRRERGLQLFEQHGVLATLDIRDYYPSVGREGLEVVLGRLELASDSFEALLEWLDLLHTTSTVSGLPIGPGGSEILGNALLRPGDAALAAGGLPFLRYMDDTWVFLRGGDQFPDVFAAYQEAVSAEPLGFVCHPVKCKVLDPFAARETIQRSAIQYAQASFTDPDQDDHDTALELFEFAMASPDQRAPEFRAALGKLTAPKAPEVFRHLVDDPTLLALAPGHWCRFVRSLLGDRRAAKATDAPDWLIEQATRELSTHDAWTAAVLLHAAASVLRPSKEDGDALFAAARAAEGWAEPVQAGAAYLWGRTQAYKPDTAVEATEAAPTFASKRGYAVTLDSRRDNKKMPTWVDGIRRSDPDLTATAKWLLAA